MLILFNWVLWTISQVLIFSIQNPTEIDAKQSVCVCCEKVTAEKPKSERNRKQMFLVILGHSLTNEKWSHKSASVVCIGLQWIRRHNGKTVTQQQLQQVQQQHHHHHWNVLFIDVLDLWLTDNSTHPKQSQICQKQTSTRGIRETKFIEYPRETADNAAPSK